MLAVNNAKHFNIAYLVLAINMYSIKIPIFVIYAMLLYPIAIIVKIKVHVSLARSNTLFNKVYANLVQ